ncbi:MAG: hypothetical protein GXO31_01380 [Epsilonproteobacteria bacterium]|nr:hypothetical protein [Campylobacterota bacterium]
MKFLRVLAVFIFMFLYAEATTIQTQKAEYQAGEEIVVNVTDMAGNDDDWIGIYPAGASNDWENVVSWAWTNGIVNGEVTLPPVNSAGEYEVRAFFNNSFNTEASYSFSVVGNIPPSISCVKDVYIEGERIVVNVSGLAGNDDDWIGIYPRGASNDWENVVAWRYTGGVREGQLSLDPVPPGNYDIRVFFNDSFNLEAQDSFAVEPQNNEPTVYEDAEDGSIERWARLSNKGHISNVAGGADGSARAIMLWGPFWYGGRWGEIDYKLYLNSDHDPWNNHYQHILEFDIKTNHSWEPCFYFELPLMTSQGRRVISFDTYIPHTHQQESRRDMGDYVQLSFGISEDYRRGRVWKHVRLDLQEYVNRFEPDNIILSVDGFVFNTRGGDYLLDNIRLVSE